MFYSQCLLSRKGPLGGVWVAAYCHKRLKKDQVTRTDIPFSVDKILVEGLPTITYRVLGYLLLGVVRIFSKKVEYFFDDCHEVLTNIKKVSVGKKIDAHEDSLRAPYHSITLPESFELDAFDFEVIEDVTRQGLSQTMLCNMLPHEEIMLKDSWRDAGIQNYFLDEYVAVAVDLETFSRIDAPAAENVPSPHLMDDAVVVPSRPLSDSEAIIDPERLRNDRFSEGNGLNFEIFDPMEASRTILEKNGKEHQTEKVPEMELCEIVEDQAKSSHHNRSDSDASMEKLHDNRFLQEECQDFEMICEIEEEPPDLARPSSGNDMDAQQTKLPEVTQVESRKPQIITKDHRPLFVTVNATPESKFPDVSGATTPESMAITTPANKERARILSKRKCLLDKEIVLPNKVLRESIHDPSGLVCKRRKAPHTDLDVWKACRIPKLSQDFLEPFTPCISSEIRFLLCNKKPKAEKPVGNVEVPEKLDLPGSPTVCRPAEQTALAPEKPVGNVEVPEMLDLPGSPTVCRPAEQTALAPGKPVGNAEVLEMLDLPGSPTVGRPAEQTAFAPETPVQLLATRAPDKSPEKFDLPGFPVVGRFLEQNAIGLETRIQCSTSMGLFEGTDNTISDRVRPVSSFESVEKEPSSFANQESDLDLMNEEMNAVEGDSRELNGWTVRTRKVARYLQRSFLNRKRRREEGAVNLMQVLRVRTKKESARLFYEILVLKTKGLVDVNQDTAYADIIVRESPRLEENLGTG